MQLVKRSYAGVMHVIGELGPLRKLAEAAQVSDVYGWRRWAASLLAIHDVKRMIALGLPWWNVRATREIEEYLARNPGARVFEYGAGASTAWLARRAGTVISVEHNEEWQKRLVPLLASLGNAVVWKRDLAGDAYVGAIDEAGGQFDLIVIDGRRRTECLVHAMPHLKPGGVILFDDSGRRRYRSSMKHCGLQERRHFGRSYCVPYPDSTSILYGRYEG
ncbi:MAG TPA: class I SAM-dependent methyltransferase [Sphingobium sp.]|nr:class I SAM-dependent methyltransferase [Sphingobium sp.]